MHRGKEQALEKLIDQRVDSLFVSFFAFLSLMEKGMGRKSLSRINGRKYRKGDTRNGDLLLEIARVQWIKRITFIYSVFLSRVV